jgi:hypothetical protein
MKKTLAHLLALTFLFLNPILVQAQTQLGNSGFEQWEKRTFAGFEYQDPSNWYTLNQLQKFGFDATTIKTNDAHSDSSAVLLSTTSSSFGNIPGLITGSPFLAADGSPDMNLNYRAFGDRPQSIQFWYKSFPETGDQSAMYCLLTKWNNVTSSRDTVAEASWSVDSTVATYTHAMVPFEYKGSMPPDSMYILFSSSIDGFEPVPGSELYLDDILFNYAIGNNEVAKKVEVKMYPNPAQSKLSIKGNQHPMQVVIFDRMGKKVYEGKVESSESEIDLQTIPAGLYHVVLVQTESLETTTQLLHKIN